MGREGTTLGFYSWGIKYEQPVAWGQAVPFIWESVQNSGEERRQSTSLIAPLSHLPLPFPFLSFFFTFFPFFRVFLLIRTPCIAFINHPWHTCVYNGVLCTCEYNNYINESIAGRVSRGQQLDKQFSRDKSLKIIHTTSDGNQGGIQCATLLAINHTRMYVHICMPKKQTTHEPTFAESRNRDECSGDRLPVARVT